VTRVIEVNFTNVPVAQDIADKMAWERRGNRRYFYRSVRVGGKVKKKYLGRGPLAEVAAEGMEVARLKRDRQKEAMRVQREEYQQADAVLAKLADAIDQLLATELIVAER
jgi:hypothetical protein